MSAGAGESETVPDTEAEARERDRARIRTIGRPVRTVEELYGPGPGPDDPEDLEAFLASLEEQRQPRRREQRPWP